LDERKFLDFLSKIEKCKCYTRHNFTTAGRAESVAEHSWRLSAMAYLLAGDLDGVDTDKVIKMCLIHDFGEAVTGDIPSFQKSDKDIAHEDDVVQKLAATLPTEKKDEIAGLFDEMAEKKTIEAKVWRALDMMEAVISHNEADIATWIPIEYELQQTYGIEEAKCHPVLEKLRAQVLADTLRKIETEGKK